MKLKGTIKSVDVDNGRVYYTTVVYLPRVNLNVPAEPGVTLDSVSPIYVRFSKPADKESYPHFFNEGIGESVELDIAIQ
jgi:hypothetical protein